MIIVAGEALIDLAPRGELLLPLPGGSPYNVAVGLGRLGSEAAFLGGLSRDGFGTSMADRLRAEEVDLAFVTWTDDPTSLAVVHLDAAGRASYGFYLAGTSATALDAGSVSHLPDDAALHVSLGAIGLEQEPTGHTLATLMEAEGRRRFVSFDPNVRPSAVASIPDYAALLDRTVQACTVVKVSDEDLELLYPARDPLEVARGWAGSGPALVVVTRGANGAVGLAASGGTVEVGGETVDVVDTVGAGDAFTSGLLAWLDQRGALSAAAIRALDAEEIAAALRFARHVAAITCTRAGSDPPRRDELAVT